MRNNYVSVIVDGKLDIWTGPSPAKDAYPKRLALARAEHLKKQGKEAYAVEITEILPEDVPARKGT